MLGGHLDPEVEMPSLKMYTIPEQKVLAYLFLVSKECMTYSEYSSCFIDESDPRKAGLRVLVSDLAEGERRTGRNISNGRMGARIAQWLERVRACMCACVRACVCVCV